MREVCRCCAGLDVHKKSVVVCLLRGGERELRSFPTMTDDLTRLGSWLVESGCEIAAMESTGVYWKPVYNVLEGLGIEVLVVNARHIKAVPGRKSDVRDAEWIADLLRHGLLRGSFIPDRDQRELRELVHYRRAMIEERSREAARLQKILEGANIKLGSVASDVLGVSGRAMLESIAGGNDEPTTLAALARGRLKSKREDLERALTSLVGAHQRMLIGEQLHHIDELDRRIERLDEEVGRRNRPFARHLALAQTIPGIGPRNSEDILAEIGVDMTRFPTHRHLASWAKVCPGLNESAGKHRHASTGHGNTYLTAALVEAAWAASRKKNCFLAAQYHRLAARLGKKRAAIAVAHSILVILYHVLRNQTPYNELGPDHYDQRHKEAILRRSLKRLRSLGYEVKLQPAA